MISTLIDHPCELWLVLGGLLLIAEMLGTNGYLLWSGISALLTAGIVWVMAPVSWAVQGLLFAILTLLCAFGWYRWLPYSNKKKQPELLNQPGLQMIGRQLTLTATLVNGQGRVNVGDSSWPVLAGEDLVAGTPVIVRSIQGIMLCIEPCTRSDTRN